MEGLGRSVWIARLGAPVLKMVAAWDPLPCPATVAWAEHDRILPPTTYREAVRTRLPGASFIVVPGVGHAAMVDDPGSIRRIILATMSGAAA